jgi:hypothetical protein
MTKHLLILTSALFFMGLGNNLGAQSTATDFTINDCNGKSCKLFDVLDSGHVVVICWVMPCANCTSGATKSFTAAKNKQGDPKHKVYYYLVDDYGNSACSTVTTWGGGNGVDMSASFVRSFSNAGNAINMTNYGTTGMPKAVVIAGPSHKVYYNVNGSSTINTTKMEDSITKAFTEMNAASVQSPKSLNNITVSPNPVTNLIQINSAVPVLQVVIRDLSGREVCTEVLDESQTANTATLPAGVYFVQCLTEDRRIETIKVIKN